MEFKKAMTLQRETKRCYVFTCGGMENNDLMTVYFKKRDIEQAGIDPRKGIVMTVEEAQHE